MEVDTSSTTLDRLLFKEAPRVPWSRGSDKMLHAVVMTERYAYDDSEPHVAPQFRYTIPQSLKTHGKLRLYAGEQGFLFSVNPKVTHGMVLFMKGQFQVFAVVPLAFLRQGSAFRRLADKTSDNVPLLEAPAINLQPANADNLFDKTVRTLWNLISLPESLPKLRELQMDEADIVGYFNQIKDNVDSITNALLPEVRRVLQSGEFTLRDLTSLRHYSEDWPSNQASVIYMRLYLKPDDMHGPFSDTSQADINRDVGVYVGQSRRIRDRQGEYRRRTIPGTRNAHLKIAIKSSEEDRLMLPIMIWEDGKVSSHILNMAEQTMTLLMRSYQPFLFIPDNDISAMTMVNSRRAKLFSSFQVNAASATGWPRIGGRGCNVESPLYGNTRSLYPLLSIPMAPGNPNARTFTSYRIRRTLFYQSGVGADVRFGMNAHYSSTRSNKRYQGFRINNESLLAQRPKYGYLVFEIMDDDKPHPRPYIGAPSVGPFKKFSQASSFGVHLEWFNESARSWCKVAVAKMVIGQPSNWTKTRDVEGCSKLYREAMMIIQALRGFEYTGTLNGFPKRVTLAVEVSVMKTDHLLQEYSLTSQPRVSCPAPAKSDWGENFSLMVQQFSSDLTLVGPPEAPLADDESLMFNQADVRAAGQANRHGQAGRSCDACLLSGTDGSAGTVKCEPDPSHPHGCCKLCSLYNRPCTFTALSQLPRFFGDRQPWRHKAIHISLYPTGPYRLLIYHRSLSNEDLQAIELVHEPFEERFGVPDEDREAGEDGEGEGQVVDE